MQRKVRKHPQEWSREAMHDHYNLYAAYKGWLKPANSDLGGGSLSTHPNKMYCSKCKKANKVFRYGETEVCPICKSPLIRIANRVKMPRKKANKRTWAKFEKRFCKRAT